MNLGLNNLKANKGTKRSSKRRGRGNSSGKGTYCTRGLKGQRSRSGGRTGLVQRSLKSVILKLPKFRGFKSIKKVYQIVNLSDIDKNFTKDSKVTRAQLMQLGLVNEAKKPIKILGQGKLEKKIKFDENLDFSHSAVKKIKESGSIIEGK